MCQIKIMIELGLGQIKKEQKVSRRAEHQSLLWVVQGIRHTLENPPPVSDTPNSISVTGRDIVDKLKPEQSIRNRYTSDEDSQPRQNRCSFMFLNWFNYNIANI